MRRRRILLDRARAPTRPCRLASMRPAPSCRKRPSRRKATAWSRRLGREQQAAVAGGDHHVVGHARQPRFRDRHGAVVRRRRSRRTARPARAARVPAITPTSRRALPARRSRRCSSVALRPSSSRGQRPAQHARRRAAAASAASPGRPRAAPAGPGASHSACSAIRPPRLCATMCAVAPRQRFDQARHRRVRAVGDAVVGEDLRARSRPPQTAPRASASPCRGIHRPCSRTTRAASRRAGRRRARRRMNSGSRTLPTRNSYSPTFSNPWRA